jgi:hypothetical protein
MTDLNISDSVVMGNIEHKTTCPNCSSISNQIFACRQCKVLFCCNICITDYNSEKSKKIQHKIGFLDKSIMRTDLTRVCALCSISYLEKNHCSLLTELTKFNSANSKLFHSLFSDNEFSWEISSLTESQILEFKDLIEEINGIWYSLISSHYMPVFSEQGFPEELLYFMILREASKQSWIVNMFEKHLSHIADISKNPWKIRSPWFVSTTLSNRKEKDPDTLLVEATNFGHFVFSDFRNIIEILHPSLEVKTLYDENTLAESLKHKEGWIFSNIFRIDDLTWYTFKR